MISNSLLCTSLLMVLVLGGAPSLCAGKSIEVGSSKGSVVQTKVKLITPKDGKDKRVARPLDEVSCSMFLPDGIEVLRGAVYNPFYENTVHQEHWRTVVKK